MLRTALSLLREGLQPVPEPDFFPEEAFRTVVENRSRWKELWFRVVDDAILGFMNEWVSMTWEEKAWFYENVFYEHYLLYVKDHVSPLELQSQPTAMATIFQGPPFLQDTYRNHDYSANDPAVFGNLTQPPF